MKKINYRTGLEHFKKLQAQCREHERRALEAENQRIMLYLQNREKQLQMDKEAAEERKKNESGHTERMCAELLEITVSFVCLY